MRVLLLVTVLLGGALWAAGPEPAPAPAAPAKPPSKPASAKAPNKPSDTTVPTRRPRDREIGRTLWRQSCSQCHGAEGHGDGPAAAALPQGVPTLAGRLTEANLDAMTDLVLQGRGRMPAYSETIERGDVKRTLRYVMDALAGRGAVEEAPEPEEAGGDGDAQGG